MAPTDTTTSSGLLSRQQRRNERRQQRMENRQQTKPSGSAGSVTPTGAGATPQNNMGGGGPTVPSVSSHLNSLMSQDSPLMRAARTRGAQASNSRGLLNSSMGVQAGEAAALDVALPIASQEANLASHEREKASSLAAAFENTYSQMLSAIMQNPDIPRDVRHQYIAHTSRIRDSNMALVEQMYGVDLKWASPKTLPEAHKDGLGPKPAAPKTSGSFLGGLVDRMNQ